MQAYLEEFHVENTRTYIIPADVFRSMDISVWKFNRPPDDGRVWQIREWMVEANRMDGMLNLAYVRGQGLVCYEGNHRRIAWSQVHFTFPLVVDIAWDMTDDMVKTEFVRLNMAISVPDVYVGETSLRVDIEDAVASFRKKYPGHESASGRPCRPNYNRDKLTDEFTRLQRELRCPVAEMMDRLDALNDEYRITRDRSMLSPNTQVKCDISGLWLFAWSTHISASEM
jgi:hypothetical protein